VLSLAEAAISERTQDGTLRYIQGTIQPSHSTRARCVEVSNAESREPQSTYALILVLKMQAMSGPSAGQPVKVSSTWGVSTVNVTTSSLENYWLLFK